MLIMSKNEIKKNHIDGQDFWLRQYELNPA
jgi:hypothetical protein